MTQDDAMDAAPRPDGGQDRIAVLTPNYAKRRLRDGKLAMGIGVNLLRGSAPGLLARANGYDFLFIDMEHAGTSVDDAGRIAIAALGTGVTPLVRCCKDALYEATRVLDNGALGVVIPHVDTPEEARAIVSAYLYPPRGNRSITNALPQYSYGLSFDNDKSFRNSIAALNDELLVVAMIETPQAVANADAIAAVEGVDVLMIGATDLAATMDLHNQIGHAKVRAAFARVGEACRRHGKSWGMGGVYLDALARDYFAMGARFILAINDHQALMAGSAARAKAIRALEVA
jgi:2-keto-3-deoxy-L-rhamnonate aldolase RhmA